MKVIQTYTYVQNNPVNANDPSGEAGEMVVFPGYAITYHGISVPLVHAGVVGIDSKTGAANYYQFGLYNGAQYGEVQGPFNVGTVQFDSQSNPTTASLAAVNKTVSTNYGQGITPMTFYKSTADTNAISQYAARQAANVATQPYSINPFSSNPINTCINFSWNALQSEPSASPTISPGGVFNQPIFDPRPSFNDGLGSAAGGFLLYPNKPNTNQMQSVYRK